MVARTSKEFVVPAPVAAALTMLVELEGRVNNLPVVLQTVDLGEEGFSVKVVGYGAAYNAAYRFVKLGEAGIPMIRVASNKTSKHIGEPGGNIEKLQVEMYHTGIWVHPQYGAQFIHRFRTKDGDELTWNTKQQVSRGWYSINARIKNHVRYDNIDQTAISHCKLTPLEASTDESSASSG